MSKIVFSLFLIQKIHVENVKVVDYKILSTFEDVMKHFTEAVSNGEEGTVVKEFDGVWKNGKPSSQCKVKKKETFDLKVVAFNYGEKGTKNERRISSLDVTSEDGTYFLPIDGIKPVAEQADFKNNHAIAYALKIGYRF